MYACILFLLSFEFFCACFFYWFTFCNNFPLSFVLIVFFFFPFFQRRRLCCCCCWYCCCYFTLIIECVICFSCDSFAACHTRLSVRIIKIRLLRYYNNRHKMKYIYIFQRSNDKQNRRKKKSLTKRRKAKKK